MSWETLETSWFYRAQCVAMECRDVGMSGCRGPLCISTSINISQLGPSGELAIKCCCCCCCNFRSFRFRNFSCHIIPGARKLTKGLLHLVSELRSEMSLIEAHWRVLEYQIAIYFAFWAVQMKVGVGAVNSLWLTAYTGKCRDMITFSLPRELSSRCQRRQCCKSKICSCSWQQSVEKWNLMAEKQTFPTPVFGSYFKFKLW